ncbi:hypothetical protein [Mycobacterium sp. 852014-52144_SCH5372336]|uniref:hypothetical protein n=1 Tax=Mycobacterium sp. 852014-52144_SCH5372336 TaxID=1834115 RepID=UPI001E6296E2|nr:hypothetical protein [Mycobacterium sp. 852014-52144_SCH5372336]
MNVDMSIPTRDEIESMSDTEHKVLENRLRRAAERQGLRLVKSRAKDPRSHLYGTYMLVDAATDFVVFADHSTGRGFGLDLVDVAGWLFGQRPAAQADAREVLQ